MKVSSIVKLTHSFIEESHSSGAFVQKDGAAKRRFKVIRFFEQPEGHPLVLVERLDGSKQRKTYWQGFLEELKEG